MGEGAADDTITIHGIDDIPGAGGNRLSQGEMLNNNRGLYIRFLHLHPSFCKLMNCPIGRLTKTIWKGIHRYMSFFG